MKLDGLSIEIKPSPNTGLRIPIRKWILNHETLQPYEGHIKWNNIIQYKAEELFGSDYRSYLKDFNSKKPKDESSEPTFTSSNSIPIHSSRTSLKAKWRNLIQTEEQLLPFTNYQSNEILQQLIPKYRACNLSVYSVINRLQDHIIKSPEYTNDLTDPPILERRVMDFYSLSQDSFIQKNPYISELPDHLETIVISHRFVRQRTKGIRQYFLGLLNWKALHDRSLYDKPFLAYMNDMYPYYAINRQNGFYPLPSKVQKIWNKNYNSLLPWLKEIGILKDSGLPYSPIVGICKYYEIHLP